MDNKQNFIKYSKRGIKNEELSNSIEIQKKFKNDVKEYKERTFLKRIVFIDKALSYASLRDLLKEKENVEVTRQYLYGIISGRLTPSYEFAVKLCRVLGLNSIYTVFDQNEIHLPNFQITNKIKESDENANN
jgi:DNA-binding XRE family transcriptional regulator